MRVAILTRDAPPVTGGIADHTDRLARALLARGADVTVVCSPPADLDVPYLVHDRIASWDAAGYPAIAAAVRAAEPDVILWQYNPFSFGRRGLAPRIGTLARLLARAAPLVPIAHELWFPWGREGARGLAWAIAQRVETRAVLRHSARFVVTTERRVDELGRDRKVRVIPIGANIEPGDDADRASARASLGLPPDAFVLAHLGSVGPGRDLGPVLDAVRVLRAERLDARLVLVGRTGPFTPPPDLLEAISLTGVVPERRVSAALSAADVYVHPDPSGPAATRRGSLMAALAHGLPVVAYRGPDATPQLIDGRNVVLVEPHALGTALRSMASDPERARRIGDAARETYERHFSWDRVGEQTMRLLEECTG